MTVQKRILALALSAVMLLGLVWQPVYAVDGDAAGSQTAEIQTADHWFYNQLSDRAKTIYSALESAYKGGSLKDGKTAVPLNMDAAAAAYLKGDRSLFNDFSAAKDAFDLEHPEAWYFDSAQLTLTVEGNTTSARASMGTGKSDSYYVMGANDGGGLAAKDTALKNKVDTIVSAARKISGTYGQIKYVHDQVVKGIGYKYEYECKTGNAGFIRTAYALVTGEGVCEGYVRSFQMILNELGIPCVPVHGTQTSGDPEAHMWCAVYIKDEKSTGWYVVDPTWDDPLPDGHERDDYFMVGNDVIGANWIPSGYVSTGAMEFAYPSIAPRSYGSGQLETDGLVVTYDDGLMEGTASTVYRISYNGMGLYEASQKGFYFLTRMCDINADGSINAIEKWYYPVHMLLAMGDSPENFDPSGPLDKNGNKYYRDTKDYLLQSVSNCEFVEYAVTTAPPPAWKTADDLITMGGDHTGTEADIIAKTVPIYNPNGGYEQPPYAKNVKPALNESSYVGKTHTIHMEFTDPLYHPDQASIDKSAALGKVNEAGTAKGEKVGVDYTGMNFSWGMNSGLPHEFAVRPEPKNVRWYCTTCGEVHYINNAGEFPDITSACRLTALEFEFTPSVMWADDSVLYQFYLTGLVGVKSNKKPSQTGMAFAFENASCSICYRCPSRGGIDWNLWGQPQLLDDPNNLDFGEMTVKGVGGKEQSIKELYKNMNLDDYDMNGRLLLVVEDAGADKAKADTLSDLLESDMKVDLQKAVASALYEIDFARICGQTVVKTGQSLRMQVGFPAGFDASNLSTTVFKVYHFIKDEKGEIKGVEEIPVTVTPYGLVFQVSSFSPFAIVAEETTTVDNSHSVVLVSDGNGTIEAVGYTPGANDVKGTVKLSSGDTGNSYTIKITPKSGYVLESITATGLTKEIQYNENKDDDGNVTSYMFTLSYSDIGATNAMIGVTFASVEKAPDTVEVLSMCGHEHVTSKGGTPATCTKDGEAPTVTCDNCGQVLSGGEVIHATGHVFEAGKDYTDPTCTEPGTALKCKNCNTVSQAPALGHEYYEGVCVRCHSKEQYTVTFDPNGGKIVSGEPTKKLDAGTMLKSDMLPVVEKSGAKFVGWYTAKDRNDPKSVEIDPGNPKKTLEVTYSVVLYAAWDGDGSDETNACVISVSASPSNGGTVTGGGEYKTGDTVTLTAAPASGYSFAYWSEDGSVVSSLSTYSFTAAFNRTLTAVFTQNSSSGGSEGTGTTGVTTKTETAGDGTVTTTVTDRKTGATTVTVTRPDGSVSVSKTDAAGNISRQESFADGVKVSTTIPVGGSVTASVTIPEGMNSASVTVQAPVTAGTVAVNSATGKVVMLSVPVDGGLKLVLDGSADIVLVDRAMEFNDMPNSHWATDSVDFVTAHGLFYGTGDDEFSPEESMTRAMLMTVLARLDGINTGTGDTWYVAGREWAMANGISDGTDLEGNITREQLAAMLYRYAGSPEFDGSRDEVPGYPDAGVINDWAYPAMRWAVQNGIIRGSDDGKLHPGGNALRCEVSAMIERFCRNVLIG